MYNHLLERYADADLSQFAPPLFIFLLFFFMISVSAAHAAESYRYDRYNRLIQVHSSLTNVQYNYDAAGNRLGISTTIDDFDFDGISDALENAGCTSSTDADSDDDGISDGVEDANHNGNKTLVKPIPVIMIVTETAFRTEPS